MEENGYAVTTKPSDQLASIKQKNRVPNNLAACHTALVDGYVVEGHVPVLPGRRETVVLLRCIFLMDQTR
jgi:hypothetical protein